MDSFKLSHMTPNVPRGAVTTRHNRKHSKILKIVVYIHPPINGKVHPHKNNNRKTIPLTYIQPLRFHRMKVKTPGLIKNKI